MVSLRFRNVVFLVFVVFFGVSSVCWGSPVLSVPHQVVQSGEVITLIPKGDEDRIWFEDSEGNHVSRDSNKTWRYVLEYTEKGASLGGVVGSTLPPKMKPSFFDSGKRERRGTLSREMMRKSSVASLRRTVLVILVTYENLPDFSATLPDAESVSSFWFGNSASVKDYYEEISSSKVEILPAEETQGTTNDGIVYITLEGEHPDLGANITQYRTVVATPAIEAAASYCDFASYDRNEDGILTPDELSIVLCLHGVDAASNPFILVNDDIGCRIYPFQETSGSPISSAKGVGIYAYCLYGTHQITSGMDLYSSTLGVPCHEFGHLAYGMVDLYDYGTDGTTTAGVGDWGLYGSGNWGRARSGERPGESPVRPVAWNLIRAGILRKNLLNVETSFAASGRKGIALDHDTCLVRGGATEYFIAEFRSGSGYDQGLFSLGAEEGWSGVLISHIDETVAEEESRINDDENHPAVAILEAHGSLQHLRNTEEGGGNSGKTDDAWGENSSFGENSDPSSEYYDGNGSGVSFTVSSLSASGAEIITEGEDPEPTPTPVPGETTLFKILSFGVSNNTPETGEEVVFHAEIENKNDIELTYHFSMGDGTNVDKDGPTVIYAYLYSGIFKAKLTILDAKGNYDSEEITLTVTGDPISDTPTPTPGSSSGGKLESSGCSLGSVYCGGLLLLPLFLSLTGGRGRRNR